MLSDDAFTSRLPELQRIAFSAFRHLTPDRRDEAVQNVLTLCWKQYRALVLKGRTDAADLLKSILFYSIKQTNVGRMIQGQSKAKDTFEQRRRGNAYAENVDLNNLISHATPVPDQASFRQDIPRFFDTLTERQQRMAHNLAAGCSTNEVAKMFGISPGAVSQFRTRFKSLFEKFFAVA